MLRPDRTQAVVHGFDEAGPSPNHDTDYGFRRLRRNDFFFRQPVGLPALSLPRVPVLFVLNLALSRFSLSARPY